MYKTPLQFNREMTAKVVPSMRWDGKEDLSAWRNKAKTKLLELLGLPFKKCDEQFKIEFEAERDDFIEIRFTFQSEEGFTVPAHLWIPKIVSGEPTLALCIQGHSTGMHISMGRTKFMTDDYYFKIEHSDFAVQAIKKGYYALCVEQRNFGALGSKEDGSTNCTVSSLAALLIGRTAVGERVWDMQRALDVVAKHFSEAMSGKVICLGISGGGKTTFYTTCLDDRIQYCIVAGYLCSYDDCIGAVFHCPCNFIPNIRLYFDMGDLAGLIAPRPMIAVAGTDDPIFPQPGVRRAFKDAMRMYKAADSSKNLKLIIDHGPHRFFPEEAWKAMDGYTGDSSIPSERRQ
jgi:cephalosporin-C deacetylase-like acetyl esterase